MAETHGALSKSEAEGVNETETLPHVDITGNLDERLMTVKDPYSFATEQFKILRSRLLYPIDGRVRRTIMVTSAMQGEGKSLVAANLAISIAQGIKEHVLLVDCDIRIPGQHILFRVPGERGLSDYLSRDVALNDLLVKTAVDKLTLLPGGKPPDNPAELLSAEKMNQLIDEVKNRYDDRFIIFDATPAEITAEVSVLAKQVDGILLVIKRGYTDRDMIQRTVAILDREKILGVVFNKDAGIPKKYDYYYDYYKGSKRRRTK
ncbi:MAG: polysaccharide biosynthesis tyrosine autokinase [Pseudomonadota bacterium]